MDHRHKPAISPRFLLGQARTQGGGAGAGRADADALNLLAGWNATGNTEITALKQT